MMRQELTPLERSKVDCLMEMLRERVERFLKKFERPMADDEMIVVPFTVFTIARRELLDPALCEIREPRTGGQVPKKGQP